MEKNVNLGKVCLFCIRAFWMIKAFNLHCWNSKGIHIYCTSIDMMTAAMKLHRLPRCVVGRNTWFISVSDEVNRQ